MKLPTRFLGKKYSKRGRSLIWLVGLAVLVGMLAAVLAWARRQARMPWGHVVRSKWIHSLPDQVFSIVADPRKSFLTDNPFTNMEVVGEQTEGVGTTYRWDFSLAFGLHFGFDEVATAWEPERRFAYKAVKGWDMAAETRLEPEGHGTRVIFTLDCRLVGIWAFLPPAVMNLGVDWALTGIARRAEEAESDWFRVLGWKGERTDEYIPALRYRWLTLVYDFAQRWIFRESIFKVQMVKLARIEKGYRVLDLGCGTATLTILIKELHPDAEIVGLDGDPEVLEIARSKAVNAGVDITFDHGMAFQLPYPSNSFDRVLSSLMFHHLTRENKYGAMREVLRVLRPGGEFHLTDLGKQHGLMYLVGLILGRLEEAVDNVRGLLPQMLGEVGFERVEEAARFGTPYGTVSLYVARKPEVVQS